MTATASEVESQFREFVLDPRFPCLAGKGVVNGRGYRIGTYGVLGSRRSAARLARDLERFLEEERDESRTMRAYAAVFTATPRCNELEFEQRLWEQLVRVDAAAGAGHPWAPGTSADPDDPAFSFSVAGRALFVIGLHRDSSRLARQFRWPTLIFNPHEQFDRLRESQKFDTLKGHVREREIALQGSLNPNLADFGARSEARQYSGRHTEEEWQCPFHRRS